MTDDTNGEAERNGPPTGPTAPPTGRTGRTGPPSERGDDPDPLLRWPKPMRLRPIPLLLGLGGLLAVFWTIFVAIDFFHVMELREGTPYAYERLFNSRPVEWSQWLMQTLGAVTAGFVAGRLWGTRYGGAATFFAFLSVGMALMAFEDAGDVRHVIRETIESWTGIEIWGFGSRTIVDIPYSALLAFFPVYALVRYGRHLWSNVTMRWYLVGAYGIYAIAALSNAFRAEFYADMGERINRRLLGGRFPGTDGPAAVTHHQLLMDSVLEETLEYIGAAFMLAIMFAFVTQLRRGKIIPGLAKRRRGEREPGAPANTPPANREPAPGEA